MIPYRIDNVLERTPWMNWLIIGATCATSAFLWTQPHNEELLRHFTLGEGSPVAIVGYLLAHGGPMHLVGNMLFLWVFGNGVCAMMGNRLYGAFYLVAGAIAGLAHLALTDSPVIGASGAINGVVAAAVAFFPFTKVSIFYMISMTPRFAQLRLWGIALYWTALDVLNASLGMGGVSGVAYWAHVGGTASGLTIGLTLLAIGRAQLSQYDDPSLLDILRRRKREDLVRERGGDRPAQFIVPTVNVATDSAPVARPTPIRMRSSSAAADTATPPRFVPAPAPASLAAPTAAPVSGDEADCFIFNGREKLGPFTSFEALERIRGAASTTGWLYWQAGMPEWTPVPAQTHALAASV